MTLTRLERDFISEPFDLQRRISYRDQPALEVSGVSFGNGIDILQRLGEHRSLSSLWFRHVWSLPRLLSFQFTNLVQPLRTLRVQDNVVPWNNPQFDRGHALSKSVDCSYGIFSRVFRNSMADVKSHVSKVERHVEPGSRWKRLAIVEEFDPQVGVVKRLNLALEVGCLSFVHLRGTLKLRNQYSLNFHCTRKIERNFVSRYARSYEFANRREIYQYLRN